MTHLGMGIFLTMFGVLLTLDRLELVELSSVLRFWPIGFHVLGATILMRRDDRHALLINSVGIARVDLGDIFWPIVILFVGVRLILRARNAGRTPPTAVDAAAAGHRPNLVAVLSESKGSVGQALTGANLTSVLGGSRLDLRLATVPAGTAPVVDVFSLLGGLEIVVPSGWTVVFDVVSILSGTDDKRLPAVGAPAPGESPQIIVRGIMIFSGLTLKSA
jgi:hypothetical protein